MRFNKHTAIGTCCLAFLGTACEKPAAKPPPDAQSQAAHTAPAEPVRETHSLTAADPAKDDPGTPSWLPNPEEIAGWVRTSNVQLLYAGEWQRLGSDKLKDCVEAYTIKSALNCRYQSTLPDAGGAFAEVTLVEAYHVDDAFGLTTSMMPLRPPESLVGSLSCFETTGESQVVHGWQDKYYIHITMTPGDAPAPQFSIEKLAAGLLSPIPSTDPPALLSHFPTMQRIPGHVWIVRKHLHILDKTVQKSILRGSALETTKALGLNLDTLMAVVAYHPGEGEKPNYLWVVQYPTIQAATGAVGRYKSMLRKIKPTPLVLMDMPRGVDGKPNSRYLCGTWTADQESIMHLLPQLVAHLPK